MSSYAMNLLSQHEMNVSRLLNFFLFVSDFVGEKFPFSFSCFIGAFFQTIFGGQILLRSYHSYATS